MHVYALFEEAHVRPILLEKSRMEFSNKSSGGRIAVFLGFVLFFIIAHATRQLFRRAEYLGANDHWPIIYSTESQRELEHVRLCRCPR